MDAERPNPSRRLVEVLGEAIFVSMVLLLGFTVAAALLVAATVVQFVQAPNLRARSDNRRTLLSTFARERGEILVGSVARSPTVGPAARPVVERRERIDLLTVAGPVARGYRKVLALDVEDHRRVRPVQQVRDHDPDPLAAAGRRVEQDVLAASEQQRLA